MYALGLGAALVTGKSEISQILSLAGVSVIGVLIVIASTTVSYTHLWLLVLSCLGLLR